MRVTCVVFRAIRLCSVVALWVTVSGCFNMPADSESPASASEPAIKLYAGTSLPQTVPDGTLMSFSIDYRFTQGRPDPTAKYVWVIERSQGDPFQRPVQLNDKGTLQILIPGWRPGEGPFESHIAIVVDQETLAKVAGPIPLL